MCFDKQYLSTGRNSAVLEPSSSCGWWTMLKICPVTINITVPHLFYFTQLFYEGCCSAHNTCINTKKYVFCFTHNFNFLITSLHIWQVFYVQRHSDHLGHTQKSASDEDWMKIILRDQYTVRFADLLAFSLLTEVNSCKNINDETWGSHKALPKVTWDLTLYF